MQPNKRARQNVIFEFGLFFGLLGRERVCALHTGGVELPSDIHGLVYNELDAGGGWEAKLYSELQAAGLPANWPRPS
jgi:Predicted nucleotide-binding protein containing TIR-like domain